MDRKWWQVMQPVFHGECVSIAGNIIGVQKTRAPKGGNSGAGAMLLARHRGASRIILLGYDCQYGRDGKRHWHGDHCKGLGNANSLPKFYGQFQEAAGMLADVEVINASRETALDLWPRMSLEEALDGEARVCAA
ncbi:hypothetical protein [Onishia taeanensis]|nr:hypothetical protein [Halomonas taeanensis]